jgi:pimeloyl-ACP methyl ester carboxylesterase
MVGRVEWYGQPDGEPVFYFHGHPGSRLEARFARQAAAGAGLRVIALDRPGYGLSDFQPERAITDWPADVAEAADLLRIGRFSVAGASGGGPYALACAWRLPGRVTRAAVISGVGPYRVPGITKGMRWQNRIGFRWGSRWPALARALMRSMHRGITRHPERTIDAIARAMSPADAELIGRPGVREILIASPRRLFRDVQRERAPPASGSRDHRSASRIALRNRPRAHPAAHELPPLGAARGHSLPPRAAVHNGSVCA